VGCLAYSGSGTVAWELVTHLTNSPYFELQWQGTTSFPGTEKWEVVRDLDLAGEITLEPGESIDFLWTAAISNLTGAVGFGTSEDVRLTGQSLRRPLIQAMAVGQERTTLTFSAEPGSCVVPQVSSNLSIWHDYAPVEVRVDPALSDLPTPALPSPWFYRLREH